MKTGVAASRFTIHEEHCSQKFAEGTIEVEFSIKIEMNTDSVYPSGAEQSSCKISGCGNK